jgi:hypothetical protein
LKLLRHRVRTYSFPKRRRRGTRAASPQVSPGPLCEGASNDQVVAGLIFSMAEITLCIVHNVFVEHVALALN